MTKDLNKVIKKCFRLRNNFFLDWTETFQKEYKMQINFSDNLLKKVKKKKKYFTNVDLNSAWDNRKLYQNVKPLLSNKVKAKPTIKLIENDEMIDNQTKIAETFNKYFVNIVKSFVIFTDKESGNFTENNVSEV